MFYSEINCVFTMLNRKREKNLGVPNNLLNLYAHRKQHTLMCICLQGVLLPDRQTFRSDSRHEGKHYEMGNHGAQTTSVGGRDH